MSSNSVLCMELELQTNNVIIIVEWRKYDVHSGKRRTAVLKWDVPGGSRDGFTGPGEMAVCSRVDIGLSRGLSLRGKGRLICLEH